MDDLISRAAAIAEIEEYLEEYSELEPGTGYHSLKWCAMEEAKDVLSMLPAVDAAPVMHGAWFTIPDKPAWDQKMCSVCGECFCCQANYCPNCGAKMDGEQHLTFTDQSGAEYADNPTV